MTEWTSADSGEYPVGRREFQDDFQAGELRSGSSSERRPDAISRDFLTAFCIGPIGFSDTSQGAVARAWRVRVDGRDVYIAGAGESEWIDEVLWLTVPDGSDLIEVDLAFTQSADPVVCFERADGNIWIYWFDPTIPGLDLVLLGPGRNPKVILDDPFDVTNSDVQLFYISDAQDSIVYRTQRERYANEHLTPVTGVQNLYLEDAIRDSRYRMHLVASERDQVSGRYPKGFFNILSTELFPILLGDRFGISNQEVLTALVQQYIIDGGHYTDLFMVGGQEVLLAEVVEAMIKTELGDRFGVGHQDVTLAEVVSAVIFYVLAPDRFLVDGQEVVEAYVHQDITILFDHTDTFSVGQQEVVTALVEVA